MLSRVSRPLAGLAATARASTAAAAPSARGIAVAAFPRASAARRPGVVAAPARRSFAANAASADSATASLYDRLGGDAIRLVTSNLFDKLLVDPELGHFFEADTLPKHKAIVSRFLIGAMGGPNEYKGRNMVDAHIGLVDLKYPEHFNIVAGALSDVLSELNVPEQETGEVMALVSSLEPDFKKIAKFRKMMEEDEG